MSKTKNTRKHYLIVQAHMSHGYQIFETCSGAATDDGRITWPGLHPLTLRAREDNDPLFFDDIYIRVRGQQGSGLRGIDEARVYGNRIEIQCAHDGYNSQRQVESLSTAWKKVSAKLKKFDGLGASDEYTETCIRLAAALGFGLAYRQGGETKPTTPDGFRHWVQTMAERAVNVEKLTEGAEI